MRITVSWTPFERRTDASAMPAAASASVIVVMMSGAAGLAAAGLTPGFECGPGTVLAGLAPRIVAGVPVKSIFDLASAQEAVKLIQ